MANKNEEKDVYYIPSNFLTTGRLFGGTIRIRNAIEAGVLVLLTAVPIVKMPFSLTVRIIILCLITLPLGILGIVGIDGDSMTEFAANWFKWLVNRRILYRSDAKPAPEDRQQETTDNAHQPPAQLGITIRQPRKRRRRKMPKLKMPEPKRKAAPKESDRKHGHKEVFS